MVVQHNLTAMNSNRMLGLTTSAQAKSTEKLSSGYKINRAADDAAGLSISEKMRKQIRGLTQASLNAADGISAVQTAEGALNEVQDMLQRMNELAVKASNGTMSEDDRGYIQDEIDQLITEIDRVSETTKFNETYLLKGKGETPEVKEVVYSDLAANKPLEAKITNADGEQDTFTASTDTKTGITTFNLGTLADLAEDDTVVIDGKTYTMVAGEDGSDGESFEDLESLVAAIQKTIDDSVAAGGDPSSVNISSVTSVENEDGTSSLILQSRTDNNRTLTAAKTYVTETGLTVEAAANQLVSDGQEVTIGKVELAAESVTKAGVEADLDVDEDKFTYGEMSFVHDGTSWSSTDGTFTGLSDDDLAAIGITTDGTTAVTGEAGMTISVGKTFVAETTNQSIFTPMNGSVMDLSGYEVGDEIKVKVSVNENGIIGVEESEKEAELEPLHFSLQVGADTTEDNKISIDIESMSAKSLSVDGLRVDGKDSKNADEAVDVIAKAIQKVSTQRSALGAVQNRLEHTINNLDNVVENTTAAESQIRDTDMATEMVKFSNNNILAQAGQAMLAQANQANQGVLSLLG